MWPRPCVSDTDVVVLPSPAFVGVIAVTLISFASGAAGEPVEDAEVDLRLVAAVGLDLVGEEPGGLRDLGDGPELRLLGDLERRRHVRGHFRSPRRLIDAEEYD